MKTTSTQLLHYITLLTVSILLGCKADPAKIEAAADILFPLPAPSALSLQSPSSSAGLNSSPVVRVSGVESGHTVKIYSDVNCANEVASALASATSLDLTLANLTPGAYTFYAKTSNATKSSACSDASVSYTVQSCPGGYVPVYGNSTFGTNDFCVMQYEAKNDGAGNPISQAETTPWVSINQATAKSKCTGIGSGYDLISNPEWMTIAHDVEAQDANWSNGSVGDGCLFRGNTSQDSACEYNGGNMVNFGTGRNTKARHFLSSGAEVWDMSANVWEWVDWTLGGSLAAGPTTCTPTGGAFIEFPAASCGALSAADYMPGNPAGIPAASYNSNYGIGRFIGGNQGALIRGTNWNDRADSGIFTLTFQAPATMVEAGIGFRCVYRP